MEKSLVLRVLYLDRDSQEQNYYVYIHILILLFNVFNKKVFPILFHNTVILSRKILVTLSQFQLHVIDFSATSLHPSQISEAYSPTGLTKVTYMCESVCLPKTNLNFLRKPIFVKVFINGGVCVSGPAEFIRKRNSQVFMCILVDTVGRIIQVG